MKALIVSRLGLHTRIIEELRKYEVSEFEDYFAERNEWRNVNDIEEAAKEKGCEAVVLIANFKAALELLARGFKRIFVITPKYYTLTEIVTGELYVIEGSVKAIAKSV